MSDLIEMRQQLADVTAERDEARASLEECIIEMRLALEDSAIRSSMTIVGRKRFLELTQAYYATLNKSAEVQP